LLLLSRCSHKSIMRLHYNYRYNIAIAIVAASSTNFLLSATSTAVRAEDNNGIHNDMRNLRAPPRPRPRRHLLQSVSYPSEEPYSSHSPTHLNPERGFYTQLTYRASSPSRLDVTSLVNLRSTKGESMILRMVYLDEFLDGPISQSVLEDVEADFGSMRTVGVKCVLRFAYTSVEGGITDPIESIVLNHIAQLKDILTANQDAILAVQAGLVGPWGEWHGSTNFADDVEGRRSIVNALLDAVPERTVAIRTPLHKQTLYASVGDDPALFSSGHVSNGGFDDDDDEARGWGGYIDGYVVESTDFEGGSQSAKVTNGAARQRVTLTAGEGQIIEISGFSKRVGGEYIMVHHVRVMCVPL